MDLSKLNSKEFQQEFQELLQRINKEHHLSLQAGLLTLDDQQIVIHLEETCSDEH